MKKKLHIFLIGLSMCIFVMGCGINSGQDGISHDAEVKKENVSQVQAEAQSETEFSFVDDLGREVTVDRPQRVVPLISSFADIWSLAGGVEQIVAATDSTWKYFDLDLGDEVVNLGPSKDINMEQLIACEPDLVLASCGTDSNVEMEAVLSKAGISAAYFSVDDVEDYVRMLDICTRITGQEERYQTYGLDMIKQIEQVKTRIDGREPKVLYVRATGTSCKVKNSKDSVLGEMLFDLGCVNIADKEDSLLEQLSMEVILKEDPEYIFVVIQGTDPTKAERILESTLLSQPAWSSLTAVQEDRYFVMDSNLYNMKPNARWGEAYEKLADILYPEK